MQMYFKKTKCNQSGTEPVQQSINDDSNKKKEKSLRRLESQDAQATKGELGSCCMQQLKVLLLRPSPSIPPPKSGWDASPRKVFAKIVIGFPYSSLVAIYTPGFSNGPTAEN